MKLPPAVSAAMVAVAVTSATGQETPPADEEIHGSAAAFALDPAVEERVWLEEGTLLHAEPDAASERLLRIDAPIESEVLERDEAWYRIRYLDRVGWVNPRLPRRGPDLEVSPAPLVVEPPLFVERSVERRRIAAEVLGIEGPNRTLGPYRLMTNVAEAALLEHLERVVAGLADSYRTRFAIDPAPPDGQIVVLFQDERTYRRYESAATDLAPYGALGHAGANLAVMFAGEHDVDTVTSLLIHELTHLMNRTTLGETPPPWLEEGIANDLAYSKIDRRGRLLLGTLNGVTTWFGGLGSGSAHYTGALASLSMVVSRRARREGTPIEQLVTLGQSDFLADDRRSLHYAESTFLLRFLLEAERGRYADGLRRYIERSATGSVSADDLERFLGEEWKRLERRFDAWLDRQAVALFR